MRLFRNTKAGAGEVDFNQLPRHIAIIMDGNGRWAKQHKLATALGHRKGVESLREIIRYSSDVGIAVLSLYAFSTENWKRSPEEVSALMGLILDFFHSEIDELDAKDVRIRLLGDVDGLPEKQARTVRSAQERTQDNNGLQLNIALNYGGQAEILRAVTALCEKAIKGDIKCQDIDDALFQQELYTAGQPMVDLLIRTSGEMRISNFLLWQAAYTELYFSDRLWPDFDEAALDEAIAAYGARERRFGKTSAQVQHASH